VRTALVDIFLLPDRDITALKRRFIKKRTEPNVLSFPEPLGFPHPQTKKRYLGEVYLNRDILKRSPERAAPLLLHGILHLLGYDHIKKADAVKMEGLEAKVAAKIL
jgi:probable rRNA maturation factor